MKKKDNEISIRCSAVEYLTYIASVAAISQYKKRIYEDGELIPEATIKKYLTVQTEGERQLQYIREIRLSERKFYQALCKQVELIRTKVEDFVSKAGQVRWAFHKDSAEYKNMLKALKEVWNCFKWELFDGNSSYM